MTLFYTLRIFEFLDHFSGHDGDSDGENIFARRWRWRWIFFCPAVTVTVIFIRRYWRLWDGIFELLLNVDRKILRKNYLSESLFSGYRDQLKMFN